MKYLIAGLGNIGIEYQNTRHNIGFEILDAFAESSSISFSSKRLGDIVAYKYKGRELILLKPSTYMNRSGRAVNYWLKKAKIPLENLLVLVDDIALPFGTIRVRKQGSDGGHNGLEHIIGYLGTKEFARLRFGIGSDFPPGQQINYVLGKWEGEELKLLPEKFKICKEIILTFVTIGVDRTMNLFNNK